VIERYTIQKVQGNSWMSRSPRSTTPRSKSKSSAVCEDFPLEFTTRVLSLTSSFYEYPSIDEFCNLHQVPKAPPKDSPERTIEFDSPVADLRLRRRLEAEATECTAREESLTEETAACGDNIRNAQTDLADIFVPDTLIRPPADLDAAEIEPPRRRTVRPLNILEIEKETTQRLAEARLRGQERAKRRRQRYEHNLDGDQASA
jgi:hypothetical protein